MTRRATVFAALALVAALCGVARAQKDPYRTLDDVNGRLAKLADASGGRARVHRITTTPMGREVLALEVDLAGHFDDAAPVLLVHGAIHGNEWISAEVVLHLAEVSLAVPDPRLAGLRLHFVPVVNADGFATGQRKVVTEGKKYDPNRAFPVPFQADFVSPPLIQAFRDYARRGRLAGVLDYHSAAESISWPWAFSRKQELEDLRPLAEVVERMARAIGLRFGQTSHIISYRHQGTAQDWFAHAHGVPAVLFELSDGPSSPDRTLQMLIDNERPFRLFARWLSARAAAARR